MIEINSFDAMQISLASPEKIREWSHGEVTKPDTGRKSPKKTDFSAKKYSDPQRTTNAIAVNINASVTKE